MSARIAVIVPGYNVAARIAKVLRTVPLWVEAIYVVDDGSLDRTGSVVREQNDPRVRLITHPSNKGVGAAIATGYRQALLDQMDILCVLAGDGQMDPDDLAAVIAPVLQGVAGYAKGNRLRHSAVVSVMPTVRLIGNISLSALTRWATGLGGIGDSQCGYTAMSAETARKVDFDKLWPRYGYPNDLLGRLARLRVAVVDVVVRPVYEGAPSGIRWSDALVTIPAILLRTSWRRLRDHLGGKSDESDRSTVVDPQGDMARMACSQIRHPGGGSVSSTPPEA